MQHNRQDHLFPPEGQRAAHRRLTEIYRRAGGADSYVGEFHDGPHKFDRAMQESAFGHLERWLS